MRSRNKIRRFLKHLKTIQQIEQQKSHIVSIITIINYEKYQGNDTTEGTTERQQKVQPTRMYKNVKEKNSVHFENFRKNYPRKIDKKKSERKFITVTKKTDPQVLID